MSYITILIAIDIQVRPAQVSKSQLGVNVVTLRLDFNQKVTEVVTLLLTTFVDLVRDDLDVG